MFWHKWDMAHKKSRRGFCGSQQSLRAEFMSDLQRQDFAIHPALVWIPPIISLQLSFYLFKPSDPVCVCSREYIQSTCGASPIQTDRGRSGWASERLCGKSLSRSLKPPQTQKHGRGTGSSSPIYVKIFSNQMWWNVRLFLFFPFMCHHHRRNWNLLAEVLFTSAFH